MQNKNMAKTPRINKTKEDISAQMAHTQKIERQKVLARLVFPFIQDQKTIYNAQTVVNAAAGYIKQELALKASNIIVKELTIDISRDKGDKVLKDAVINLVNLMQTEKADDAVALLERFGNGLGEFSASKYMENSMDIIKLEDFVA